MQRKKFLRHVALGIAISLLPKVLQPVLSTIEEETCEIVFVWTTFTLDRTTGQYIRTGEHSIEKVQMKESEFRLYEDNCEKWYQNYPM